MQSVPTMTGQSSAFELPRPTGPRAIGTTTWHVEDPSRQELFAPGSKRQVQVLAWYPIGSAGGARAAYLRAGAIEARTFATLLRAPAAFDHVAAFQTHAALDAPPDGDGGRHPLLLFSHGYTGAASSHTALLEDLASHGYVVLNVVHPYEAVTATLVDGRVVAMVDEGDTLRQPIRDVFAEWASEDKTMAAVTSQADPAAQVQTLRRYLGGLAKTDLALRRWVDDTRLVLDRIGHASPDSLAGRLARRVDMNRIGVLGHSMGGVTAGQFCVEDARCRAGLNLDGIPQYGTMIDRPLRRPFLMVYSARPGRAGASDAIYRRAARPYYRVDVRDTLHLDFSDLPFWKGPLAERGAFGTLGGDRATAVTRTIVREYFDQELLGRRSPLLSRRSSLPEATVTVFNGKP
jgi:predicted dienelactone hydrolase